MSHVGRDIRRRGCRQDVERATGHVLVAFGREGRLSSRTEVRIFLRDARPRGRLSSVNARINFHYQTLLAIFARKCGLISTGFSP